MPEVLDRIQLRRVRGQGQDGYIGWDFQPAGGMESGLVPDQYDVYVWSDLSGHLFEEDVNDRRVDVR